MAVDIEATLECDLDGDPISVDAGEGVIVINVESPKMARVMIGCLRRFGGLRSVVARVNAALLESSHRMELRVEDTLVAELGHGTESGFLRLVGFPHVRCWPLRLFR